LECLLWIPPRSHQRGRESKHQAGDECEEQAEEQHRPIHRDAVHARNVERSHACDRRYTNLRQQQSGDARRAG
jgi:hypothetical protein